MINLENKKKKSGFNLSKKTIDLIKFIVSIVIIFIMGYIVFNYVPFVAQYDHYVIATDSMEPVIDVGDIVIIDTDINLEELTEGQIIAFYADIRGDGVKRVVVHYLDDIKEVDGEVIYKTKPEISDSQDPWELTADDIVGIKVLTIPKVGPFLLFAQSSIGRIVLLLDIVMIYMILSLFPKKETKKSSRSETTQEEKTEETQSV